MIERDDRHEISPRPHPVAHLGFTFGDISGHGCADLLAGKFQMRQDEFVLRQFDRRMFHHGRAADLSVQRVVFGLGFPHVRFQRLQMVRRVLQDLFGNGAAGRRPAVPVHIVSDDIQSGPPGGEFLFDLPLGDEQRVDPSYSFSETPAGPA